MKHNVFILFIFSTQFLLSQSKRLWVVDSLTQAPISDVQLQSSKVTLISNAKGEFNLSKPMNDFISVNHPCCYQIDMYFDERIDTIYLQRIPQIIEEITVNSDFLYPLSDLGYYFNRKKHKLNGSLSGSALLVVFIPYSEENTYINKIMLDINSRQQVANYGVNLYEADSAGMPGTVLYEQKIAVDSLKKEGVIDVRDHQIKIPENGIFIGLQNFGTVKDNTQQSESGVKFHYTEAIDTSKTYISLNNLGENSANVWIPIESYNASQMTPFFGLEVYQK